MSVLAVLLVLLLTPAWVDPVTVLELSGGVPPSPRRPLLTPDPRTGVSPLPVAVPSAAGQPSTVARDTFSRSATSGWGSAEVGGAYSARAEMLPDLAVEGGAGVMRLPTGAATRAVVLDGVAVHDGELSLAVSVDKVPTGGNVFVQAMLRRDAEGASYLPRLFITPDGAIYVHAGLTGPDGQQSLGREVLVANIDPARVAGTSIRLRVLVGGSDPSSIFVKAWDAAGPEPAQWQFGAIDWMGRLQGSGAAGVGAYLGRNVTNAPITVRITDLTVTASD